MQFLYCVTFVPREQTDRIRVARGLLESDTGERKKGEEVEFGRESL